MRYIVQVRTLSGIIVGYLARGRLVRKRVAATRYSLGAAERAAARVHAHGPSVEFWVKRQWRACYCTLAAQKSNR